jgi:serpin B
VINPKIGSLVSLLLLAGVLPSICRSQSLEIQSEPFDSGRQGTNAPLGAFDDIKSWSSIPETGNDPVVIASHERGPLSADALALAAGNNHFAVDIYRQLSLQAKPDSNVLVSPFSISAALAMTYAGGRGNTAQQMANILGFALPDERLHPAFGELLRELDVDRDGYELSIANRLFGQIDYPFQPPFVETTDSHYGAPLESLDFIADPEGSRQHINHWVESQTNDKIKDLLPRGSIKDATRLVLANAVHFDGAWKSRFDEQFTEEEIFHAAAGKESLVSMMWQHERLPYMEHPDFQMLELPYAGDDLSMVVVLPRQRDGLPALEARLTNELLDAALSDLREQDVNVFMPKFTFDASFNLSETLQDMGITDAFDEAAADLRGIADPLWEKLFVSDVLHKTFIDVNEEGTEAAAATSVIVGAVTSCLCAPPQPKIFRADHPFLFALRDRESNSLLFMGRVVDPGKSADAALAETAPEPSSAVLMLLAAVTLGTAGGCRHLKNLTRMSVICTEQRFLFE